MSAELEDPTEQTVAARVSSILTDFHRLVEQQLQLTRLEVEEELYQFATASAVFAIGMAVIFLAAIMLSLTVVHLLHWATSPAPTDLEWLPLWQCHAVVAAALAVVGSVLSLVGRAKFRSIQPCHNPVTSIFQEGNR